MIIDELHTRLEKGRRITLVSAYLDVLGVQPPTGFAQAVLDLLEYADSIPVFEHGQWLVWVQTASEDGEHAMQFSFNGEDLRVFESTESATHLSDLPEGSCQVTLTFRARKTPLPESTDVSHPAWEVIDVDARPTEVHFDVAFTGLES